MKFLKEEVFPVLESWPLILEDFVISDNSYAPSS
jgi:hypothetical protein